MHRGFPVYQKRYSGMAVCGPLPILEPASVRLTCTCQSHRISRDILSGTVFGADREFGVVSFSPVAGGFLLWSYSAFLASVLGTTKSLLKDALILY
jgi:hypothetical protein